MKDLNILPEHLRGAAKPDGPDFAWPLDMAEEVLEALVTAGAVIKGVEAWVFDEDGVPAVMGWSSYDVGDWRTDWKGAVERSKAEADGVLAGVKATAAEDNVDYVGIDWAFQQDMESAEEF